jgi:Sulfatase
MADAKRSKSGSWSGLAFALSLAFLLLAGSTFIAWRELELLLPNDQFASAVRLSESIGSTLGWQLARFAAALILAHVALGLAVFGLARAGEAAFPARSLPRRWLITGWFVAVLVLLFWFNATLFPASIFAVDSAGLRRPFFGVYPVEAAAWIFGIAAITCTLLALRRTDVRSRWTAIAAAGLVCAAILTTSMPPARGKATVTAPQSRPHVVIVGIDSMRRDRSLPRLGRAAVPHVEDFLAESRQFTDATTPLARTFGSWVAILTGRHPVTTQARVNLMPRELVQEGTTLADMLHGIGYRTIYATDESRFANIDESYGFDQLITPPTGAVDLLLGLVGDMPLVNLVAATSLGRLLFPSSHANRAAHVVYQPADFVRRIDREIEVEGPSLIAIHLTLAHWPYSWAGTTVPSTPQDYRLGYRRAIEEVDRQFDAVMRVLTEKGVLDNALVVLLSDHGEALGAQSDSMLRETGTHREIWHSLWGHGTSVMSPDQYRVLFAMRAFGRARLPGPARDYDWPVSLEDLRPTLEQLVTGEAPIRVDGLSLVPYLEEPARASALASRIRFTETDFNTQNTLAGRYEPSGIVDQAAEFYELDPGSGWIQFRRSRLPDLLAQKQRAALTSDRLLAAIPGPPGQGPRYLLTDRHNPRPVTLEGPPERETEAEARRLWDALESRFPGELGPKAEMPRL